MMIKTVPWCCATNAIGRSLGFSWQLLALRREGAVEVTGKVWQIFNHQLESSTEISNLKISRGIYSGQPEKFFPPYNSSLFLWIFCGI